MTRVNLTILLLLVICGIALVTSQHRTRKLVDQLQREQERAQALDEDWGRLQLEQRTWATHDAVERFATKTLGMRIPMTDDTRVVLIEHSARP